MVEVAVDGASPQGGLVSRGVGVGDAVSTLVAARQRPGQRARQG